MNPQEQQIRFQQITQTQGQQIRPQNLSQLLQQSQGGVQQVRIDILTYLLFSSLY